jgi:O-antigen/teichoic acid export membrane protein
VVLIIPKLVGVEEYGYWQLYLFYSSYVGFLHFGWIDGIYLRYGGKEYQDLDKRLLFSQFYMLVMLQLIIAVIIASISVAFFTDKNRIFIFQMTALCLLFTNVRYMLLFILQCTNRIKEYAQITMMGRILYCGLIIIFLLVGVRDYKLMIVADLIGRFISLSYAMNCCSDIVFRSISTFYISFKEAVENISAGIKLMFANIASMLIVGVVRFGIERSWDVSTFGKVSLTLSISNLMMLFINAVGIIMFPVLRRTNENKLPGIYVMMRDCLMGLLFGALTIYYPLKVVISAWLPKYADSLVYMALIFPICVYEGKMSLLINTYLKTLRKEKLMLKINLISLTLSLMLTFVNTLILKNLNLAIGSIVILLAFRCALAEIFLSRILEIPLYKDIILELMMTFIFILTGWFINSWLAVLLYVLAYIMYIIIKRKDISNSIKNLRLLTKA